jgi:hypothetical protein
MATTTANEPLTYTLRNGIKVVAKVYKGEVHAKTFANRTQATKAAEQLGPEWKVCQWDRPFYVTKFDR